MTLIQINNDVAKHLIVNNYLSNNWNSWILLWIRKIFELWNFRYNDQKIFELWQLNIVIKKLFINYIAIKILFYVFEKRLLIKNH